jgi:DNA-binding ferritin-like protein (Dps family)
MFRDEARLLKKENDDIARWLEDDDEDIIDKITDSLGIFRVNSFDAQVIRRDLIGMAEEARLRGSTMKEVIGDDIKLTTYDIIKSSRGHSKLEIVLLYLKYLSGIIFVSFALSAAMQYAYSRLAWEVSLIGLFSFVESITWFFLIAKLVRPLLNMDGWGRFGFYWTMFAAIGLGNYSFILFTAPYFENAKTFIQVQYLLLMSAIVFLFASYHYRQVIGDLAKDNKNYFEDLKDIQD